MKNVNRHITLLLVEDNPGDARLIKEYLGNGNKIVIEQTLADALHNLTENKYDIILLNLNLPDSKGLDTFNKIYNAIGEIPIIVLTGLNDKELAQTLVRHGAQNYLTKG